MVNKYYTPDISEFHKGFEFEWFQNEFEKEKYAITTDDDLEIIDDEIREGKIRVKLLDREDVKSLEFEFYSELGNGKNKTITRYWSQELYCSLMYCQESTNMLIERLGKESNDALVSSMYRVFKGKIKNKSELQKLLIQLDIK